EVAKRLDSGVFRCNPLLAFFFNHKKAALSEPEWCLEIERDLNHILFSPSRQSSSTLLSDAKGGLSAPFTFMALGKSFAAESDHVPRPPRQQQKPPARRVPKRNPPHAWRNRRENQEAGGPEDRKPRQDHRILVPSNRALNNSANAGKGTQRFAGSDGVPMMPGALGPSRNQDVIFLHDLERRLLERPEAQQGVPASFLEVQAVSEGNLLLPLVPPVLRRQLVSEMRMDVKNIPHPVKVQVKAIDSLLKTVRRYGLTKEEVELRKAFAEKLEASLRETLP
ncbi:hypothetical protein HPB47_014532, partial [Ixodes persulcatus]